MTSTRRAEILGRIAKSLAEALEDNEAFQDLVDEKVEALLMEESGPAMLTLIGPETTPHVFVTIADFSLPSLIVELDISEAVMPCKSTRPGPVEETRDSIASARALAARLTEMANAVEADLEERLRRAANEGEPPLAPGG
jgi:hypothetical protein